jgi:hypothetical protein
VSRYHSVLSPLLENHPLWPRIFQTIKDSDDALEYGNHKSARHDGETLLSSLHKEVVKGWQVPIPIWSLRKISDIFVGPLGLADQMNLSEPGERIPALRVTHDVSKFLSPREKSQYATPECITETTGHSTTKCDGDTQPQEPLLVLFHQRMLLGFFFAMRSCESLRVQGNEWRTKPIMKKISCSSRQGEQHDYFCLETADSVTVTFEYQKRDDRDDQAIQCATEHPLICPVKITERIIRRLNAMRTSVETPIYTFVRMFGRWGDFDSHSALTLLRVRDFISAEGGSFGL